MILLNHERMGKYKPVTSRGKPGLTCVHTHTWKMMKNSWAVIFTAPQCLIKPTGLLKFPCPLSFLLNSENQTLQGAVFICSLTGGGSGWVVKEDAAQLCLCSLGGHVPSPLGILKWVRICTLEADLGKGFGRSKRGIVSDDIPQQWNCLGDKSFSRRPVFETFPDVAVQPGHREQWRMGFSVHFTLDGVSLKPIVPQDDVSLCIWFSSKTSLPPQIKPTSPHLTPSWFTIVL